MCKHDKSFNTGVQTSYLSSHERGFAKTSRAGGAPPRTDALIGPAAFGDVQKNGLFKTTRERRASLSSLLQLSGAPELVTARSNARKADLEAGPLDSHNETNHRRGSKTVPKP